jgi:hypothetical protein
MSAAVLLFFYHFFNCSTSALQNLKTSNQEYILSAAAKIIG